MLELRDESLLKLFFADALPVEQALEQLRMRRAGHEQFLALLREIEARPGEDPRSSTSSSSTASTTRSSTSNGASARSGAWEEGGGMTVATEREPAQSWEAASWACPSRISVRSSLPARRGSRASCSGPCSASTPGTSSGGSPPESSSPRSSALAIEAYERKHGRRGALALVSAAFVVLQGVVGLVADSAVVYLAQPVIVSAIWGVAYLVSAAIGRPLAASSPMRGIRSRPVKASRTYKRIFSFESVVWGVYLLARSGMRMLVLTSGSIGAFVAIQFVTGIPLVIALVLWSLWYSVRGFERSTEWDDEPPAGLVPDTKQA